MLSGQNFVGINMLLKLVYCDSLCVKLLWELLQVWKKSEENIFKYFCVFGFFWFYFLT